MKTIIFYTRQLVLKRGKHLKLIPYSSSESLLYRMILAAKEKLLIRAMTTATHDGMICFLIVLSLSYTNELRLRSIADKSMKIIPMTWLQLSYCPSMKQSAKATQIGVTDQITVMTPVLILASPENQSDVINKYSDIKLITQNRINPIKFFVFIFPS